jgi:hypothetical protein
MSEQFEFINENEIVQRFHSYLQEDLKVVDAMEMLLRDCANEDLSEEEIIHVVGGILIPEIAIRFAEKYDTLTNCFDYDPSEDNLNAIFEIFTASEGLSEGLSNALAATINTAAASDHDDEDDDDNEVVFKPDEWAELSDEQRKAKVKSFLKKLANAHLDARDLKPFIRHFNIGDQEDEYGNSFGHANEGAIHFPDVFNQGHDEDHRNSPLHKTLQKYNFQYSHSTPVTQHDGSILNNHVWQHSGGGHQIGAYHNDTKWSSKVSSVSGHVATGAGTRALDKHLSNKAKRYKLQNNEAVAHLPILENLIAPEAHARVQKYADWMDKHPESAFGVVGGSYAVNSAAKDLMEVEKLKAAHDKRFGHGKHEPHRPDAVRFFCPKERRRNMLAQCVPKHARHWWLPLPGDVGGLVS